MSYVLPKKAAPSAFAAYVRADVRRDLHDCRVAGQRLSSGTRRWRKRAKP